MLINPLEIREDCDVAFYPIPEESLALWIYQDQLNLTTHASFTMLGGNLHEDMTIKRCGLWAVNLNKLIDLVVTLHS